MNPPPSSSQLVEVLLPRPLAQGFDYLVAEHLNARAGDYVQVPFGKQQLVGVVWGKGRGDVAAEKCKAIASVCSHIPPMSQTMRDYIDWVAGYTLAPKGAVLKMALPVPDAISSPPMQKRFTLGAAAPARLTDKRQQVLRFLQTGEAESVKALAEAAGVGSAVVQSLVKEGAIAVEERIANPRGITYFFPDAPALSPDQQRAADALRQTVGNGFSCSLLEGVTGSGKTEVYFDTIEHVMKAGGQVLVLLPEIALTVQWLARFTQRFGAEPLLWHSGISRAARRRGWLQIASGEAPLVVGARSALFLPYKNLSLIVVDEEHEPSYKQEEGVMYHARDMAVARAHREQIPIQLVSATPSLETRHNVQQEKYAHVILPERFGGASMPAIELVDMRTQTLDSGTWVSQPLRLALKEVLERGHQSLLFLNRRGYAPLVLCRACGHRFECGECSAWMVLHSRPPKLMCHHCGHTAKVPPRCPKCDAENSLAACGPGVERVQEEIADLFPSAKLAVMSSDAGDAPPEEIVKAMANQSIDILIGTQMVAKGHHFPRLALVGVVDADMGLSGGDLRASERTYQLLHQLAGRAGREAEVQGSVLIQTYLPDHPVMQALKAGDWDGLMQLEEAQRHQADWPPYGRLAALILDGKNESEVAAAARSLARHAPHYESVRVLGPAPAPISRLRGRWRYRLLVKSARKVHLQEVVQQWLQGVKLPTSVRCRVDIDPYSFL